MEKKFNECIRKYEGCMEQLKQAECLLHSILELSSSDMSNLHLQAELTATVSKYFRDSKYEEVAENERRNDENTGLRTEPKRDG